MSQPAPQDAPASTPIATPEAAERFCGQFYTTIDDLRAVIERETACLRDMDIATAEALQGEKNRLAEAYIGKIAVAKAHSRELKDLAPDSIAALQQHHEILRESLLENEELLNTIRSASQSLIRRAAERVAARNKPSTYSATAMAPQGAGAAAVALDRKL